MDDGDGRRRRNRRGALGKGISAQCGAVRIDPRPPITKGTEVTISERRAAAVRFRKANAKAGFASTKLDKIIAEADAIIDAELAAIFN